MKNDKIAQVYKERRKEAQLTLQDMANRLNVSKETYRKIEKGKTRIVHDLFDAINQELDLTDADFIQENPEEYRIDKAKILRLQEQVTQLQEEINRKIEIIETKNRKIEEIVEIMKNNNSSIEKMRKIIDLQEKEISSLEKREPGS